MNQKLPQESQIKPGMESRSWEIQSVTEGSAPRELNSGQETNFPAPLDGVVEQIESNARESSLQVDLPFSDRPI